MRNKASKDGFTQKDGFFGRLFKEIAPEKQSTHSSERKNNWPAESDEVNNLFKLNYRQAALRIYLFMLLPVLRTHINTTQSLDSPLSPIRIYPPPLGPHIERKANFVLRKSSRSSVDGSAVRSLAHTQTSE